MEWELSFEKRVNRERNGHTSKAKAVNTERMREKSKAGQQERTVVSAEGCSDNVRCENQYQLWIPLHAHGLHEINLRIVIAASNFRSEIESNGN